MTARTLDLTARWLAVAVLATLAWRGALAVQALLVTLTGALS